MMKKIIADRAKNSELRHFTVCNFGREELGFRLRIQWGRMQIKRG